MLDGAGDALLSTQTTFAAFLCYKRAPGWKSIGQLSISGFVQRAEQHLEEAHAKRDASPQDIMKVRQPVVEVSGIRVGQAFSLSRLLPEVL